METTLRPKEEIVRDIEETRRDARQLAIEFPWRRKKPSRVQRMWKTTRRKTDRAIGSMTRTAARTKEAMVTAQRAVVSAARKSDCGIRQNIYTSVAVALCAGTAAGYLISRKIATRRGRCE